MKNRNFTNIINFLTRKKEGKTNSVLENMMNKDDLRYGGVYKSPTISFGPATQEDLGEIMNIFSKRCSWLLHNKSKKVFDGHGFRKYYRNNVINSKELFVYKENGKVVAFMRLSEDKPTYWNLLENDRLSDSSDVIYGSDFMSDPTYQGKGISKKFFTAADSWSLEHGYKYHRGDVCGNEKIGDNNELIDFYLHIKPEFRVKGKVRYENNIYTLLQYRIKPLDEISESFARNNKNAKAKEIIHKADDTVTKIDFKDKNIQEKVEEKFKDELFTVDKARQFTNVKDFVHIFYWQKSIVETFDEFKYFTGINTIESYAFNDWSNLKSITLPNTIEKICQSAFIKCQSLETINFPDKIITLEEGIGLTENPWWDSKPDYQPVFIGKTLYKYKVNPKYGGGFEGTVDFDFGDKLGIEYIDCLKRDSYNFETFIIPEVLSENINKKEDLMLILDNAASIKNLKLAKEDSENYTIIDECLYSADKKELLYVPSYITELTLQKETEIIRKAQKVSRYGSSITYSLFHNCKNLHNITLNNNIKEIPDSCFSCTYISEINLPNSIETIGRDAFSCCDNITSITIPDSVVSIGFNAFKNCSQLKNVVIGKKVNIIYNGAFQDCVELEKVIFKTDVLKEIGQNCFYKCRKLDNVNIPQSAGTLGRGAFAACENLHNITLPDNIKFIGNACFGCITEKNKQISVPFNDNFNLSNVKTIESHDGGVFAHSGIKHLDLRNLQTKSLGDIFTFIDNLEDVILPDTLEELNGTFVSCPNLRKINIPKSLSTIKNSPFGDCKFLNIEFDAIPKQFKDFTSVSGKRGNLSGFHFKEVTVDSTMVSRFGSIDEGIFNGTKIDILKFTNDVRTIRKGAFGSCQIKQLYISPSITHIDEKSFGMYGAQTEHERGEIFIPDTKTLIDMGDEAFYACSGFYNLDGNWIGSTEKPIVYVPEKRFKNYGSTTQGNKYQRAFRGCEVRVAGERATNEPTTKIKGGKTMLANHPFKYMFGVRDFYHERPDNWQIQNYLRAYERKRIVGEDYPPEQWGFREIECKFEKYESISKLPWVPRHLGDYNKIPIYKTPKEITKALQQVKVNKTDIINCIKSLCQINQGEKVDVKAFYSDEYEIDLNIYWYHEVFRLKQDENYKLVSSDESVGWFTDITFFKLLLDGTPSPNFTDKTIKEIQDEYVTTETKKIAKEIKLGQKEADKKAINHQKMVEKWRKARNAKKNESSSFDFDKALNESISSNINKTSQETFHRKADLKVNDVMFEMGPKEKTWKSFRDYLIKYLDFKNIHQDDLNGYNELRNAGVSAFWYEEDGEPDFFIYLIIPNVKVYQIPMEDGTLNETPKFMPGLRINHKKSKYSDNDYVEVSLDGIANIDQQILNHTNFEFDSNWRFGNDNYDFSIDHKGWIVIKQVIDTFTSKDHINFLQHGIDTDTHCDVEEYMATHKPRVELSESIKTNITNAAKSDLTLKADKFLNIDEEIESFIKSHQQWEAANTWWYEFPGKKGIKLLGRTFNELIIYKKSAEEKYGKNDAYERKKFYLSSLSFDKIYLTNKNRENYILPLEMLSLKQKQKLLDFIKNS